MKLLALWHIFKAFYDPNLSFDEMNHINFDLYPPKNAQRHTIEKVKLWCAENNMNIEHLGISCIAKKR